MITDLIQNPKEWRRHVVILGAGASLATLPDGDLNGKRLPIMNNLINIVGLEDLVSQFGKTSNFEDVYSELYERGTILCY